VLFLALVLVAALPATVASAPTTAEQNVTQRLGLTRFTLQQLRPSTLATMTTLPLELDGRQVTLRLEPASLRTPDFRVLAQQPDGSLLEVAAPPSETYRGTVAEWPGARVGGSIRDGRLRLAIALADGRMFCVQPLEDIDPGADPASHVVYVDDVAAASGTCATREPSQVVTPRERLEQRSIQAGPLVADLALDCDHELFVLNGSSVDATVLDVENVMSGVNLVYDRDCGIQHRLVRVLVRSVEPDPYTSTNPDTLLLQFRNEWNARQTGIARDLAHLMTGKNVDGGTIGIAAVGVVCNRSRAYGLSQTRYTATMSRRIALTAHELGHEWNASHCDAVVPCNIMCSTINGCDGIGLPNFEPMGKSAITSFAASRTCLDSPTTSVPPVPAPEVRFEAPRPSPFKGQTQLSYFLSDPGAVRLEIYDIVGHRVATVFVGNEVAGSHVHIWNGLNEKGERLGSGVYHARLQAFGMSRALKLIMIQ
jgi:hypothetical protein